MKILLFTDMHSFCNLNDIYSQKEDYDARFILDDTERLTSTNRSYHALK